MAAPIVYEGVNGKYEGTLFNGLKFWVSQRVPLRSTYVAKIKDNGGKEVLLEKHADVMIADHAKPLHAPAGSVSFKYIDVSVAQGALANIEEHRIRPLNAPRPAASTRQTRVPFSPLDKQILLTWVRRAPSDTRGNEIYKKLEELYPHHSWHSWRDKWVKNMSLLSEDQLPAILQELPPSKAQRAGGVQTTPAAAAPSTKPAPSIKPASSTRPAPSPTPTPASSNRYPRAVSEVDPQRARTRVRFTKEDDRILAKYVKKRIREGEKPRGNKIYDDLAKIHPHHTYQSWRDRWVRHLSERTSQYSSDDSESEAESAEPRPKPTPTARPPPNSSNPPRPPQPSHQRQPQAPPAILPAPTPAPSASSGVNGQGMTRIQELTYKRERIRATRLFQRIWRGVLARKDMQRAQASITAFQARAQGSLVRMTLDPTEIKPEPEDTAWFTAPDRAAPAEDDPLLLEEPETVLEEEDVERTPRPDNQLALSRTARVAEFPPNEQFWRDFNMYNEVNGIVPSPWAQIGHVTVDFWDLWRHATAQPHHPSRDWEAIAEGLGFDWIVDPHVPAQLKVAFEKNLLEFESSMREFDQEEEEEEEEEEGEGEEEGENEGQRVDEGEDEEQEEGQGDQEVCEEAKGALNEDTDLVVASQTTDPNFTSSPPVLGLKRARRSSGYSGSVRKRPRYDLAGEIPETPETRTGRTRQGTAEARVAAANQATPTRRPRPSHPAQRSLEGQAQDTQPTAQLYETDDDEALSPSQQLLTEIEAASPAKGRHQNLPGTTPSGEKLLPSIERDDDETASSDDFESFSNLPIRNARNPRTPHRPLESRRRTLPWAKGKDKGKQPATTPFPPPTNTTTRPAPFSSRTPAFPPPTTTATTRPPIPSSSRTPAHTHTPNNTTNNMYSTPSTARPKTTLDPGRIIAHFTAQGYPPTLVARAVRATTCQFAHTETVLKSLRRGAGIPGNVRGVWTEEDDNRLRGIGGWVDRLGGRVPRGGGGGAGGGEGGEGERGVFEGLVAKHGGSGVFGRREFLKSWDRA